MRTRGNDVNAFMRDVEELDQRTDREDRERLDRLARAKAASQEAEEDRFSKLRAREVELTKAREEEKKVLAISERTQNVLDPPKMPDRPRQSVVHAMVSESTPPSKEPKGFVSSALKHTKPKLEPNSSGSRGQHHHHHHHHHHHSTPAHEHKTIPTPKHDKTPDKAAKPSWISSAIQHSAPVEPPRPPVSRTPGPSPKPRPKPKPVPIPAEPEKEQVQLSPVLRPLKPQHAGPDPKYRTPSQSLKELRTTLKPKPALDAKELKENAEAKVVHKALAAQLTPTKPKPTPSKAPAKPKPRRDASIPEALKQAQKLKPAAKTEKDAPPSPEAHEKLKALKPAKRVEPRPEAPPEALERAKSLNKPKPIERLKEPATEVSKKMEVLRPPKPQEKEAPPSPEAIERLHSLRKPKPVVKQRVPSTFVKPQLKPASNDKFKSELEAALGAPIKRTPTDAADIPLEHLTKSRPRGPKRRLPGAGGAKKTSDITVTKRGALSKQELKRIASAKYAVKTSQ